MTKYLLALALVAAAGCTPKAYTPTTMQSVSQPAEHRVDTIVVRTVPGQSPVVLPAIPESLDFAGEPVPLGNFDTEESLRRELLVTSYMHSRTLLTLLNTRRYFAVIEPILAEYGVPDDFKYLCMAESGLEPEIVSPAGAGGLWQIMPATGKEYGLIVEAQVDERYDVEKSTRVACRYLLDSYARFGSWSLVAAAYNLGNAGVGRRIERQSTNNYYDAYFPQETLRYLFRILSFKLVTQTPAKYGFLLEDGDYYHPLTDYTTVTTSQKNISWSDFAAEHGTTYKMLRQLNHWIRDYDYANKAARTLTVKIPAAGFRKASRVKE